MSDLKFLYYITLFISVILLHAIALDEECPKNCECDLVKETYFCRNIDTIPKFLHPNNVKVLSINHHNITEIKENDFKGFYSLKQLNLSDGKIKTIEEHAFKDMRDCLELINLNVNQIEIVPQNVFSNLTRLKNLQLNYNKLERLNGSLFTNLPQLNIIKFEMNEISEVGDSVFQNVPNLQTVYFFENNLTKIPYKALQNVPMLTNLYLGFNQITSIGDAELEFKWQNLTTIALDSNQITDLTVFPKVAPNLEKLDLGFNRFSTISPTTWTNLDFLKELNLNGNKMTNLTAGIFSGLKNLDYLYLREEPELEYVGPRVFSDVKKLRYIDLSHNPKLRQIHEDAFQDTNISYLYLDNNNLTTLSQKLLSFRSLAHISLYNNSWDCDCNLRWILNDGIVYNSSDVKSKIQSITCSTPDHLEGKSLKVLQSSSLVCLPSDSDDYKSRVQTGIIVAVVAFVVMATAMVVMACKNRILLRVRKYYMYRRFKAGDGVFTVGERETEMDDVDQLL